MCLYKNDNKLITHWKCIGREILEAGLKKFLHKLFNLYYMDGYYYLNMTMYVKEQNYIFELGLNLTNK